MEQFAIEAQIRAAVNEAFGVQPVCEIQPVQQVYGDLFQHPCAHPAFDIRAVASLQHHGVDTLAGQQMGQEHACRSCADDCYLGAHDCLPSSIRPSLLRARATRIEPPPNLLPLRYADHVRSA